MVGTRPYIALSLLVTSLASVARAQPPNVPNVPNVSNAAKPPKPLYDLKSALPFIHWDDRTHGALLAIAPDKERWYPPEENDDAVRDDAARTPLQAPTDTYGLNADLVARRFGDKLVRLPTLTIFAPTRMVLLNTDLKPANPFLGTETSDKVKRLEVTLTPDQWKALGSANGLGIGDLTREQQALFDDLLPETMTVQRETVKQEKSYITNSPIDGTQQTLTPEQRLRTRIHLTRRADFGLVNSQNNPVGMGDSFRSQAVGTEKPGFVRPRRTFASLSALFGQTVRTETPNRLKPSDLDLKQAILQDTYVPLTGVKTVGDLLRVVQAKTGLEIYADGRLANLSVYLSTEARLAHASDLLEALCWALTATYRKVGPVPGGDPKDFAYVLTYDRRGVGDLVGTIADWARRGAALRSTNGNRFDQAIQKLKPGQYLSYTAGDLLAPTPEAIKAAHENENRGMNTVPISTLTAPQRDQMTESIKQAEETRKRIPSVAEPRNDRVYLFESVGIGYIVPGVGEIRDESHRWSTEITDPNARDSGLSSIESELEAARKKPTPVSRVVVAIAPRSAADAQPVFDIAREQGIAEVWIAIPATDAGRSLLAACVRAGTAAGVKVGALVSVLRTPALDRASDPNLADRNLYGQSGAEWYAEVGHILDSIGPGPSPSAMWTVDATIGLQLGRGSDFLAPESPEVQKRLHEQLGRITAVPGLSGIALHDGASPGRNWEKDASDSGYYTLAGENFGYTVANRLAFLRKHGYDPIDLTNRERNYETGNVSDAVSLPRFDADTSAIRINAYAPEASVGKAQEDWRAFRAESEGALLQALRTDLKAEQPRLPVYLASYHADRALSGEGPYVRWDDPAQLPFAPPAAAPAPAASPTAATKTAVAAAPSTVPAPETLTGLPLGVESVFMRSIELSDIFGPNVPKGVQMTDLLFAMLPDTLKRNPTPAAGTQAGAPPRAPEVFLNFDGVGVGEALSLLKDAMRVLKVVPEAAPSTSDTAAAAGKSK